MTERILLPSEGAHGGKDSPTATATCFCDTVQIEFPTDSNSIIDSFICNCTDCHKITASMFAPNFIIRESQTTHIRGQDKVTQFAQDKTIASGNTMTNHFCSVCGTLMYRVSSGYPGMLIASIGTLDDFTLMEAKLKSRLEQFTKDRVNWLSGSGMHGVRQFDAAGPLGRPFKM